MTPSGPQTPDPPRRSWRGRATIRRSSPRGCRSSDVTGTPAAPGAITRTRRSLHVEHARLRQPGRRPASISAQFTLFFDGRFWVGVLELHERRRGAEANDRGGTVRAVRHVFGAEPSDVELYDFLLTHGGALIDRAAACPPVPASRPVGSSSAPRPNPKRAARQAAKEAARARPSTAAQAALAAAREETATRASHDRSRRRRQKADEDWARRRQRAKRRHRGR